MQYQRVSTRLKQMNVVVSDCTNMDITQGTFDCCCHLPSHISTPCGTIHLFHRDSLVVTRALPDRYVVFILMQKRMHHLEWDGIKVIFLT